MPRSDPAADVTARLAALELGAALPWWTAAPAPAGDAPVPPAGPVANDESHPAAGPVGEPAADRAGSMLRAVVADRMPPWLAAAVTSGSGQAMLALATLCAVAVAVIAVMVLRPKGPAAPAAGPTLPPLALPTATASAAAAGLVVDVGGRVRHPGLVTLPPGSRVADAVRAAGGALRHRDLRGVNLAARVADGQLLMIGGGAVPAAAGAAPAPPGPVDLNSATVDQLDELPGIGPVLAQRIVDWRSAHGGFSRVEDLEEVSGIGDSTFADLAPLVTV